MIPNLQLTDAAADAPEKPGTSASPSQPSGESGQEHVKLMDRWPDREVSAQRLRGSIHLHGGGRGLCAEDDRFVQFRKAFVDAGRAALPFFLGRVKIVVLSSCGCRPDPMWHELGSVTEVAPQSRAEADSAQLSELIDAAQCVWVTGGDQGRLRGALSGSGLERALQRLLRRGGALGGSSAGASLLCALCPNFDEVMEGLDLVPGATVLTHLFKRGRQDRLAALVSCFPGLWGFGLDEAAGLVWSSEMLRVSCWSPVLVLRNIDGQCFGALLQPGFRGSLEEVEQQMQELGAMTWQPENIQLPGEELWSLNWAAKQALVDGPIEDVQTNAAFNDLEGHHFLSWKLPPQEEEMQALFFSSHRYLEVSFELEDLPLLCQLALVHQTALPGRGGLEGDCAHHSRGGGVHGIFKEAKIITHDAEETLASNGFDIKPIQIAAAAGRAKIPKAGAWSSALSLLSTVAAVSLRANRISVSASLGACRMAGLWTWALRLLRQRGRGLRVDAVAYNSAISACSGEPWQESLDLVQQLRQSQLEADVITYNASVTVCGRAAQWKAATQLALLQKRSLQPDLYTRNAAMAACDQGHAWQTAVASLAILCTETVSADVLSYSTAMSACGKASSWRGAGHVLASAAAMLVQINLVSYDSALTACGNSARWRCASHLFEAAAAAGLCRNAITLNAALTAFARSARWRRALLALLSSPKVPRPGAISFNAVISACESGCLMNNASSCVDKSLQRCSSLAPGSFVN
eukprot:s2449_g3.t2